MCIPKVIKSHSTDVVQIISRLSLSTYDPKIIIVGAGAAGIACATKLLDSGFKEVLIFEASDRIGGRIHTIPFGDNVVDLGAQWCHGQENNIVYEIVKNRNLLETSGNLYVTYECRRSNGELLPEKTISRLKYILADIFENRHLDLRSFNGSLGEYLTEKFQKYLLDADYKDIDPVLAREFFTNFKKVESSETASEVDEVSARGFEDYEECEGDYLLNWKDKGFIEFLHVLMKSDANKSKEGILTSKIIYDKRVKCIQWKRNDGMVNVKCENDDQIYVADHVIVTVSLGVLKAERDTFFEPTLSPPKKRAIDGLSFGTVTKIFLEFEQPFWPKGWTGFCTLWRQQDSADIRGTPLAWTEDVYGFYCVSHQPRLLVGWIVGKHAPLLESYSKNDVTTGCMSIMKRFLPDWEIPNPVNVVVTKWNTNPFIRGTYSYRSMITETYKTNASELAQPLSILAFTAEDDDQRDSADSASHWKRTVKPVVLFAGEATHSSFFSTVHGAVESGYREANRLIGYYSVGF